MTEIDSDSGDTTVDLWEWQGVMKEHDHRGVKFLSPFIESYMIAPVALYKGKPIVAKVVVFDDICEAYDSLSSTNERIIMYSLVYIPSMPVYSDYLLNPLERPYVRPGQWSMRYAKVES